VKGKAAASSLALVAAGAAVVGWAVSHQDSPDATVPPEVANAFWAQVAHGGSSSTEPKSDCSALGKDTYRCYAIWTPTPGTTTFVYQAEIDRYPDGDLVVSKMQRRRQ
jgi:hypothetical protein